MQDCLPQADESEELSGERPAAKIVEDFDMAAEFAEDANNSEPVEQTALDRALKLAKQLDDEALEVDRLTAELAEAKRKKLRTEREDLPALMKELGLKDFTLESGARIECRSDFDCAITAARKNQAFAWLIKNGFGGLIKTQVIAEFDRGEVDAARAYAEAAAEAFPEHPPYENLTVHPQTLKAFIREQREKGAEGAKIPSDLFGIFEYDIAKIVR